MRQHAGERVAPADNTSHAPRVVISTQAVEGAEPSGAARAQIEHRVVGGQSAGGEGERPTQGQRIADGDAVHEARARDEGGVA